MRDPEECGDMGALRDLIDAIDADLVALLARRQRCIDRASALKPQAGLPARVPERVDAVLAHVDAEAAAAGLDRGLAEAVWRRLIEWSIDRERAQMGEGAQERSGDD